MRGTLLWFNEAKEYGRIRADDGEQLIVHPSGFRPGHVPSGRCAGTAVTFETIPLGPGGEACAGDVAVVEQVAPRRARRHSGGGVISRV